MPVLPSCRWAALAFVLLAPFTAHAGMTMPAFSDIAQARLQVLSFFLIGLMLL